MQPVYVAENQAFHPTEIQAELPPYAVLAVRRQDALAVAF
jgi:hypothetical protein